MVKVDYKRPWMPEYQKRILNSVKRYTVVEASTKTGKTASHIVWLFEQALQGSTGKQFWWVAPIFAQAEIAFKRLKRQISNSSFFESNSSKLYITLFNGAEIHFKSADKPDSLYGDNVYAAVFDEFTRAKEGAWFALRSTLTATRAPCKFIGNYTGSSNWGHKLSKKAGDPNSEYEYFKITAYDAVKAGILDEEEVEQARKDLPLSVFKALYLAEGSLEEDILFFEDDLEACFSNEYVKEGSDRYISADIALHGSDRFVICIWYGWVLKEIIVKEKADPKEVEEVLKSLANKYNIPRHRIVYDADGVGSYLRGYLKAAKPFVNGSKALNKENYQNLKSQCFFKLASKIEAGGIFIKHDAFKEDIVKELEQVKKDKPNSDGKLKVIGKEMIIKILGYSPDFADAIMMRMFFDLSKPGFKFANRAK